MPTPPNRLKMWRHFMLLGLLVVVTGQLAEQRIARAGEMAQALAGTRLNAEPAAAGNVPAQAHQESTYSAFTSSAIDPQFDAEYAGVGQLENRYRPSHVTKYRADEGSRGRR